MPSFVCVAKCYNSTNILNTSYILMNVNTQLKLIFLTYSSVLLDKRKSFNFAYDFIFDRLRAIRQEIVMQNYNAQQTIKFLQPMIMFLSYSRYKLCEETVDNFDPKICDQHLQECLKRALVCYDEISVVNLKQIEINSRAFIEALYQIFNLGSLDALSRCLTLPKEIRYLQNSLTLQLKIKMFIFQE